ncbi:putative polyribonucleotide nucleotidyltransferase chloroplastic [Micractinium conductrix]|uniref:polyribonucleotide nucleotidyltransferase n=1 Tax=Micractinium conductrix TaxID=554055 RepID=A0A2P6VEN8_9CHLO|nr:putative polyribonucleotide nucleotidyltransferase chloroplastic [Micractinium conductrix]|eukprot:PSC72537.1 putative polyribonucleotide nucleotidyltransferase chloroplastic [Micractinium conductrix]
MATDGETILYTTACAVEDNAGDGSFAPLQVHYTERFSAAGRTSGGYLKREGKPKDHEVLVARLIDRPIRPMIQSGWTHSTQVLTWVMSYDGEHSPEPLAITAAGAALAISDVPLRRAVAGARVGLLPGRGFVVNPTLAEQEESTLDLMIAGTSEAVLMIEGFCDFLTEEQTMEAVRCGHDAIKQMCVAIEGWAAVVGKPKRTDDLKLPPEGLDDTIRSLVGKQIEEAYRSTPLKQQRVEVVAALRQAVRDALVEPSASAQLAAQLAAVRGEGGEHAAVSSAEESDEDRQQGAAAAAVVADVAAGAAAAGSPRYDYVTVQMALKRVESGIMRRLVLDEGFRADGRGVGEVRPIWSRANVLPRTHGSVLFTRGETQALAVTTLGCSRSAQRVDSMSAEMGEGQRFYLQYFFPPSSVGEVGRVGGPGRREVGHGNLAERALLPVVPGEDAFPYTIRVESTITESNGSSSMASVCGGCLSMMDAGVPLKRMVAGVAMGLILEEDGRFAVLTDILGSEDALGDMDFKVAGDEDGITAFQMDIKVEGITLEIMQKALQAAAAGRRHILGEMRKCAPEPRGQLSPYAPRIRQLQLPLDKIGVAIGPGGRTIKLIQETTGVEVQIDGESGAVTLKGDTEEACAAAQQLIESTVADPEVGKIYRGCRVTQVMPFGAFVEVLPKREGLLHVSEWGAGRVQSISEVVKEGDSVDVMVMELQDAAKFKLSRRAVLVADGVLPPTPPRAAREPRGGGAPNDEPMPTVGQVYRGARIKQVQPFGAFVEVAPRREGLLRVGDWALAYTTSLEAEAKEGDLIDVVVTDVSADGKFKLSRKALLVSAP